MMTAVELLGDVVPKWSVWPSCLCSLVLTVLLFTCCRVISKFSLCSESKVEARILASATPAWVASCNLKLFGFPYPKTCWSNFNSVVVSNYLIGRLVSISLKELKKKGLGEQWQMRWLLHLLLLQQKLLSDWISPQTSAICSLVNVLNFIPGNLCALSGNILIRVVSAEPPMCTSFRDGRTPEEEGGVGT